MKKYLLILLILILALSFAQQGNLDNGSSDQKKSYKVTIYYPEKKIYQNVSDLKYDLYFSRNNDQPLSSRIIEFYEQPNNRHIIIGDGWIAEENFK